MLHIAICDDSQSDVIQLCASIERVLEPGTFSIKTYCNTEALLSDAEAALLDVLFLDIQLGNENGLEAAKKVNALLPQVQIIYTTAFLAYAVDIYETKYAYFLVKPASDEKLKSALARAGQRLMSGSQGRVTLPLHGKTTETFILSDILYCERRGRETAVITKQGLAFTKLRIGEIEELLPPNQFVRPHNSFLVNLSCVREIKHTMATLEGGVAVPVSNLRRKAFIDALTKYL